MKISLSLLLLCYSNILKLHMFKVSAKRLSQKFLCRLFWGGFNPSEYGPDGAYGNTVDADDRRTQLSPHTVDGLLFIHGLK